MTNNEDWLNVLRGKVPPDLHPEDARTPWQALVYGQMRLCGCGDTEAAIEVVTKALTEGTPWEDRPVRPVNHEQARQLIEKHLDGAAWLLLYVLDGWGFTEHGGSVNGSWLTESGEKAVEVLQAGRPEEEP